MTVHARTDAEKDRHHFSSGVTVHRHGSGEGGIFANAYLVESAGGVVAIDATLTETESQSLRAELDALRKPLLAVMITHPHPDHVAGITNLVAGHSPKIIATQPVTDLMRALEEPKRLQWAPTFGAEWVQRWTYPNTVAVTGETYTFDGVTYSVLDTGPGGDSGANSVWFVEAPERTAFVGDLVFDGVHSYVADGHLLAWLVNLARLERLCQELDIVFPGHGVPAPPDRLFGAQRAYLLTLAAHVKELAAGDTSLSEEAKAELEKRMIDQFPDAGLTFLLGMSADPIARELNSSELGP
jgi:glyoxylase-like metal-dependent hydrolase (beta-lactamase superfamily II)